MEAVKRQGHGRQSTPLWQKVVHLASDTIDSAKLTYTQWKEGQVEESKKSAKSILKYLACRYVANSPLQIISNLPFSIDEAPKVQLSFDLLELFEQEFADINT
jgi:hypothetical protein